MSVRAYRVIKIEWAKQPTFNLWHDEKFIELFNTIPSISLISQLSENGSGQVEFTVEGVQAVVNKAIELGLDPNTIAALKEDIVATKAVDDGYILYECF